MIVKRIFIMFVLSVLPIFLIGISEAQDSGKIQPYDPSTYYVSFAESQELGVIGNPLDYAGKKINMDVRNFELPRGYEGRYRYACRFPIIDYVSNNPLYMKQWTEDNAEKIAKEHLDNGIGAVDCGLELLRGYENLINWPAVSDEFAKQNTPMTTSEFTKKLGKSNFTYKYQQALGFLYNSFENSYLHVQKAKQNLTDEDIQFFTENPAYYIVPDGKRIPEITGNVDTFFKFIEHARRVRFEEIFNSGVMLTRGINTYVNTTKDFKPEDYFVDTSKSTEPFRLDTPYGPIIIGGTGDDKYTEDALFLIDLGGNDIYTNNAGGALQSASILIDHSGNDQYINPNRRFVQGFGFMGVGYLVDLAGNDKYSADSFAQGAGIMGVGAIWDKSGDDIYDANGFVQGAAIFGLGMVLDDSGEDFYNAATLCQGGASTLGLGILSDLSGDDRYHLWMDTSKDNLGSTGYGQGGALSFRHYPWIKKLTTYGGVGFLIDSAGNDRYRTNGWCDQGGSYIMSLGALYDGGGNDHYTAGTGQGSGIHVTNAILIDKNGDDIYDGGFRTGASGGDRTPGFLIDYKGDDTYNGNLNCYGTACKPFAYSLFIDYEGNDTYNAKNPVGEITMNNWESFGGVWPESVSYLWPYAIFMDLGGNDNYNVKYHKNNSERSSFGHGIAIDMRWKGGDVIGKIECPLKPQRLFLANESIESSKFKNDIYLLQNPDTFLRFQAIGRLENSDPSVISILSDAIVVSDNRQFNRDAMEIIHYSLVNNKITKKEIPSLINLLNAKDAEIRTIIADDFGIWQIAEAEDALIKALSDKEGQVRRFSIASLILLKSTKALPIVREIAKKDPYEDARRVAVNMITRIFDGVDPYPILADLAENDPSIPVRVAATERIGALQQSQANSLLCELAKSSDVYLQRAAGKSLADIYQIDGIEILIKSLDFPSIDAFYNYDVNVPNTIATYTGHDFTEAERYDRKLQMKWFSENRDKIDIRANADAAHDYTILSEEMQNLGDEEQIPKLDEFLKKHPSHKGGKAALISKLNSVAWVMVSAPDSKDFNPKEGLKYALRLIELAPEPNYIDTLVEAYLANGMIDEAEKECRQVLEKEPSNQMFIDKLKRCEQAKK